MHEPRPRDTANPDETESRLVEQCLAKPDYHQQWMRGYRVPDNERFFEDAFDYITRVVDAPAGATFLDAGCGTCAHAIRLAKRGYRVEAIDFSEDILSRAASNVSAHGYMNRINIRRDNLLSLSLDSGSFRYVLCWGVLMHIPNVERAIAELSRVVADGGMLIISEGNMHSLQSILLGARRRFTASAKAVIKETAAGREYWTTSAAGTLVTREMSIPWLIDRAASHGLRLKKRSAGQFTEIYARIDSALAKRMIHGFNRAWFRHVRWGAPAYANILIFQK